MFQNKNQSVILKNEIFEGLDNKTPFIYDIKNFLEVKEGDIIYKTAESSDFVYLVIEGEIKLKISTISGVSQIFKKIKDQYFGEKEILENIPRNSSSVADTDGLLYLLKKNDFTAILQSNNTLKEKLESQSSGNEGLHSKREIMFSGLNDNFSELAFFKKDKVDLNQNNDEELSPQSENSDLSLSPELSLSETVPSQNFGIDETTEISTEIPIEDPHLKEDVLSFYNNEKTQIETIPPYTQESFYNENIPEDSYNTENSFNPENSTSFVDENMYGDLLISIKKIITSISVEDIFNTIPSAICNVISSSSGVLYILDLEKNEFFNLQPSGEEMRMKNNEGLPGLCFINQDIINFNDETPPESEKNLILFPVENDSKDIIAVLQLNGSPKGYFDETDIKIVKMIIPFISNTLEKFTFSKKEGSSDLLNGLSLLSKFVNDDIGRLFLRIKNYAEFLNQRKIDEDEDTHRILKLINDQSEAALDTLQIIKNYSENNLSIKAEALEITTVMDKYLMLLAEYTDSKKVKIFKKYEDQGLVNIDSKILYFAVFQIVKNACESMPEGGNLYFLINRNEPTIEIQIKDEGSGIPLDLQDRIFDPFFSHGKKNASGLGLSFADLIIKKHNGSLKVISDLDIGSTFIISLPATD